MNHVQQAVDDYISLHKMVYKWIDDGLFTFEGRRSEYNYTELDMFLFKLFGVAVPKEACYLEEYHFNLKILEGQLNLNWLSGPHALTLFKMMVQRKGLG